MCPISRLFWRQAPLIDLSHLPNFSMKNTDFFLTIQALPLHDDACTWGDDPPLPELLSSMADGAFRVHYLPRLLAQECPRPAELLRCQGYQCVNPDASGTLYWCQDCFGTPSVCLSCLQSQHRLLPFHRTEKWIPATDALRSETPGYFERDSLRSAGVVVQLGHGGEACLLQSLVKNFTIAHENGIYKVKIGFCNCAGSGKVHTQLFDHGIFPATENRPTIGFTFSHLQHFLVFSLASKMAVFDYHRSLVNLTDLTDPESVQVRVCHPRCGLVTYSQFMQNCYDPLRATVQQWRQLDTAKDAGRLDMDGVNDREFVICCPACPRPSVNLPEGWETDPHR